MRRQAVPAAQVRARDVAGHDGLQRVAFDVLDRQHEAAVVLEEIVEADDVRVRETPQRLGLAQEQVAHDRARPAPGASRTFSATGSALSRARRSRRAEDPGPPHDAHPSLAEARVDDEARVAPVDGDPRRRRSPAPAAAHGTVGTRAGRGARGAWHWAQARRGVVTFAPLMCRARAPSRQRERALGLSPAGRQVARRPRPGSRVFSTCDGASPARRATETPRAVSRTPRGE